MRRPELLIMLQPHHALVLVLCVAAAAVEVPETRAQADFGMRFVRVRYQDSTPWRRSYGGAPWAHDFPTAEENFYIALKRTTAIHVEEPYLVLELEDPRIYQYPVIYLCEPGYWHPSEEAVENLREYLDRGGFILFDDFRGEYEWMNLYEQMQRVFPGREPRRLDPQHPVWSIYFDIDPDAAVSLVRGYQGSREADQYFGYFDNTGRMMALANYNQDIGDGWEYPNLDFDNASTVSFQMGINFVIYALTH